MSNNIEKYDYKLAVVIIGFVIAAFVVSYLTSLRFLQLGIYDQWDVLYGSDTYSYVGGFAHGWGGRGIRHPNISNYINPPVRFLSHVVHAVGLSDESDKELRKTISLLVVPVSSAVTILFLGLTLIKLRAALVQVFLGLLLGLTSFSQLIFGAIPESFGLSGMALMLAFYVFVNDAVSGDKQNWWLWIFVGVILIGITITNIVPLGILFILLMVHQKQKITTLMVRGGIILAAILCVSIAIHLAGSKIYDVEPISLVNTNELQHEYDKCARQDNFVNILNFPLAITDTIAPKKIILRELGYEPDVDFHYKHYVTMERYHSRSPFNFLGVITFLLLGVSCYLSWQDRGSLRTVMLGSLGILFFNWVFHSFWGANELFLYSQHWNAAIIILLILPPIIKRNMPAVSILLAVYVLAIIDNNIEQMGQMIDLLYTAKID